MHRQTPDRRQSPAPGHRLRQREELPPFRYHPDPVATGAIVPNATALCPCCGLCTGWAYERPPYGREQPTDLCPWCIADGSASRIFGSLFVPDIMGDVPPEVHDELNFRTPGFVSWQGEEWQVCCGDAAIFRGGVGWAELQNLPDALDSLSQEVSADLLPMISKDGDIAGYLFQCRHCDKYLAYVDAS